MRKGKKITVALMALLSTGLLFSAVACGGNGDSSGASDSRDGSVSDSADESNDSQSDSSSGIDAEKLDAVPVSTLKTQATAGGNTATASWFAVYGEEAMEFTVYVEDSKIYTGGGLYDNDGVELVLTKVRAETGHPEGTVSIAADAVGNMKAKDLFNNTDIKDSGVEAEAAKFTLTGEKTDGYYLKISVPYALINVTKADKNAAACLGLTNANDAGSIAIVYDDSYGTEYENVNTYMAITADNTYESNSFMRQQLDVLFAGASYVEWWQTENVFQNMTSQYGMKTTDIGVAGSKIEDWNNEQKISALKKQYNPAKIAFHVGLNDVNDAKQNAEDTYNELVAMYTAYHEAFPEAHLYWAGYIPNNTFSANNVVYFDINGRMSAWAGTVDWFTYIDVWTVFCADGADGTDGSPIKVRTNLFRRNDGMHLNAEYGYPLWGATILEALGYPRTHGSVMGDNLSANYAYSSGWKVDSGDNQAVNTGSGEQAAYYSELGYSSDIYFEADFKASEVLSETEEYPKAGVMLRNDEFTVFAYFDLNVNSIGKANIVYRPNNAGGYPDDWLWGSQAGEASTGVDIRADYGKVAIAKKGATFYMLVDGETVTQMSVPGVTAESRFIAGVVGFNMKMEVKNASGTNVLSEIEQHLRPKHDVTIAASYEGVTVNIDRTKAKAGETVSFTVVSEEKTVDAVSISYGENSFVLEAVDGKYSFAMPDADVTISLTFRGFYTVTLSGTDGKVICSETSATVLDGTEISFRAVEGYVIKKLYVNGVSLDGENGIYNLAVHENVLITADVYRTVDGVVLDGTSEDSAWSDEVLGNTLTYRANSEGSYFTLAAVKGETGVFFTVTVYSGENTMSSNNWWQNANVEFRFGDDRSTQHYFYFEGTGFDKLVTHGGITEAAFRSVKDETTGNYMTVVEFFSPYEYFKGYTADSKEIPFYVEYWVFDNAGAHTVPQNFTGSGDIATPTVSAKGTRFERAITAAEYTDIATVFSADKARPGDVVTFTVESGDEDVVPDKIYINHNGLQEEVLSENGVYSFKMPDSDVNVTMTFKNLLTVDMTEVAGKLTVSKTTVAPGKTVTFSATKNTIIVKLYANGVEIVPADGIYSFAVTENIVVSGEFLFTADGIVLDGVLEEKYGDEETTAQYDDDRDINVHAVKTESGVFVYVVAHMNTMKDTESDWFLNTNFEFQLNADGQRYVNIKGQTKGVTEFKWKTEKINDSTDPYNGKYRYIVEIFVEKGEISGWTDDGTIQLNYAWKTGGENARIRGDFVEKGLFNSNQDWLAYHGVGGLNGDFATAFGQVKNIPANLHIGADGLAIGVEPRNATIDGDLTEYANMASVTKGDSNKATVKFSGFAASDGVYMAWTITHGDWSEANEAWHLNDNLEFYVNSLYATIIFYEGRLIVSSTVTKAAAKTVVADGKNVTTVELFIAGGGSDSYKVRVGMAGNGFGGWQGLLWDGDSRIYVTPAGAYESDPLDSLMASNGIVLDGEFDDSVWTESVRTKTYTTTANGATVSVMGVNSKCGVLLGFTITHRKPITENCQNDGTAWWHYMGPEIRLAGYGTQIAATCWNDTALNCKFGHKTVQNDDGGYTTTFEILVPYYTLLRDASNKISLSMGGVFESGFVYLWGSGDWKVTHYVTIDGIVEA